MRKSRVLVLLLLLAAIPIRASSVIPTDVARQVDEADLIFIGTVISTESVPVKDESFAFTYVTFGIEETLKGAADAPLVTLRFAGGKVRSKTFEIAGGPRFESGGRHLLFVRGNDRWGIPLSGGSQGKLNFTRDPATQMEMLTDDAGFVINGLRESKWERNGLTVDRGGELRRPERVAEVISQEGVSIALDQPDPFAQPEPALNVIAALREFIQGRAFTPDFQHHPAVQSASPANVPATDPDRATPRAKAQ